VKFEDKIAYLEISSWAGISINAEHHYGKLVCGNDSVELLRPLSKTDAAYLNKKNQASCYSEGMEDNRWDFPSQLMGAALDRLSDLFPSAVLLICGSSSTLDPQEPVWAISSKALGRLQRIYVVWEEIDGWDGHNERRAKLWADRWDRTLEQFIGVALNERGNKA